MIQEKIKKRIPKKLPGMEINTVQDLREKYLNNTYNKKFEKKQSELLQSIGAKSFESRKHSPPKSPPKTARTAARAQNFTPKREDPIKNILVKPYDHKKCKKCLKCNKFIPILKTRGIDA